MFVIATLVTSCQLNYKNYVIYYAIIYRTVPKTYQANVKSIFLSFLELFDKILELERNWNWSDFDSRLGEWNWTSSNFSQEDRNWI